jgi:uncharacterized phage-like protein YoqJ
MKNKTCSITGYHPTRFSFKYNEADKRCLKVRESLSEQIIKLIDMGVTEFYSGMTPGVGQWAAEIVLEAKKEHPQVNLTAVISYETLANNWLSAQRERHFNTLAKCGNVVTLQPRYSPEVRSAHSKYLVNNAGYLLAVYDGDSNGSVAYTVKYARQQNRKIIIIHPDTLEIT